MDDEMRLLIVVSILMMVLMVLIGFSIYATRDNGYGPPPEGCHWEQTKSKGYYVRAVCP